MKVAIQGELFELFEFLNLVAFSQTGSLGTSQTLRKSSKEDHLLKMSESFVANDDVPEIFARAVLLYLAYF